MYWCDIMNTPLDDIKINKLDVMSSEGGEVMHFIKTHDSGFKDFGEVYFSWIILSRALIISSKVFILDNFFDLR